MDRYLALDLGEKRVGIAISDPTLTIAQPLRTIQFQSVSALTRELQAIIDEKSVIKIVAGLPITMKGTHSQQTDRIIDLVDQIREALAPVPVELFDERLTTVQAHQTLQMMGKKPSRQRDRVDQLAAVHLLQAFLDRERFGGNLNA